MRVLTVLLLTIAILVATHAKVEVEDGVLVLTKDNFNTTITENEYVFIEFYAPWCGHCKALAPEYAKAAQILEEQGSNIKLAKIDATIETELAEQHGIRGYPTLKFYRKGAVIDYNEGRQASIIVNWLLKKTGPAAKDLKTVEEVKTFIDSDDVIIVGFFKDPNSEGAKTFMDVAVAVDDYAFGIASNSEIFTEYDVQDGAVVLFKKFDEGKTKFEGEFTIDNLKKFISIHALPLVVHFNQDTAKKIFSGVIENHLLVFLNKEAGHFEKYVGELTEPAKKFRGEVLFVTINAEEADHERILEFFGMQSSDIPAMRLIQLEQNMAKYKPDKPDITSENVLEFVTALKEGKLKRHLITQELPEDWDKNPVKVLVGTNFHEVAYNKDKNVIVEFYAPWCGHCQQLAPIYDSVGEKYKDSDTVVIAKMDATANELEDIKITGYPTIKMFKKDTNEVFTYNGRRTFKGLVKFIETDGAYGQGVEEDEEEDEDDDVPRKDEL